MNLFQGSDNNDLNKNTAFSIVELLVVVAMIGIITSIAIPQLGGVLPNSKDILAADRFGQDDRFAADKAPGLGPGSGGTRHVATTPAG